jgi:thiosulfate/3-mercaptopyruvate sulfurtransferase
MSSTEKALVSTEWLEANMDDPNIRIIESNEDQLLYFDSHIKGAVHVDWTKDLNDYLATRNCRCSMAGA